jgi:hypothetical protein
MYSMMYPYLTDSLTRRTSALLPFPLTATCVALASSTTQAFGTRCGVRTPSESLDLRGSRITHRTLVVIPVREPQDRPLLHPPQEVPAPTAHPISHAPVAKIT